MEYDQFDYDVIRTMDDKDLSLFLFNVYNSGRLSVIEEEQAGEEEDLLPSLIILDMIYMSEYN